MAIRMRTIRLQPAQFATATLLGIGVVVAPTLINPIGYLAPAIAQTPPADTSGTIVEVAQGNSDFSTLVAAVEAAGLVDELSAEGPFTVFAPTNAAFAGLPAGALDALLEPENQDLLTEILLYHVVPDEVTSDELTSGGVPTLNGGLAVRVEPDRVIVNDASVTQADIPASNGVIHAINRVLIPAATRAELLQRLAQSNPAQSSPEPIQGLW